MHLQDIISSLSCFWKENKCSVIQPHYSTIGAATLHPATLFGALSKDIYNIAHVQPCVRPNDSRAGKDPNRLSHYFQYQVLLNPAPSKMQELYLKSLETIGVKCEENDIRFIEDDWENPSVGAYGVGWEVWLNGIEISQFTYMQQVGGLPCNTKVCEITYGLERIAVHLQNKESIFDLHWNDKMTYEYLFKHNEEDMFHLINDGYSIEDLIDAFNKNEKIAYRMIEKEAPLAAYQLCLSAIDKFNILDARGAIGNLERAKYIIRTRKIANACCKEWLKKKGS